MSLDRLWAAWRSAYVSQSGSSEGGSRRSGCVFCALIEEGVSESTGVVYLDEWSCCLLNAFPYGSGHLLVLPRQHESGLSALPDDVAEGVWRTARQAVRAVERAYRPGGVNIGANLGEAAGAGIPEHLHLHVLPRWAGDTNFMTSIAETRVLPESLEETWRKVTAAWENP